MDIKDRIKQLIDRENIPSGVFADKIGVQQSTLSHILNGRNKPSLDVVMKIHQAYPGVSLEWLLYGTGGMTAASTKPEPSASPKNIREYSLFTDVPPTTTSEKRIEKTVYRTEKQEVKPEPQPPAKEKEPVKPEIRYVEKTPRKITEIRIFFDDNTYEIFKSEI